MIPHIQEYWAAQIAFGDLKNNIGNGEVGTFGRGSEKIKLL